MKKNTAVTHVTPHDENHVVSSGTWQFAHTLKPSFRSLLFLLAAGMFLFSCKEEIKPSSEAAITSLTLTVGSMDYPVTFTNKQSTIKVPHSTELSAGAVVKAVALSAKATGVKTGETLTIPASGLLTLTVIAEDGTTKTYTITIDKGVALSSEASLTTLTLMIGSTDYPVTFTNKEFTITVPHSTELPTDAVVKAVEISAKATGVKVGETLRLLDSEPLTLTVTAEDGKTTETYTITVDKATAVSSEASITSLTLTVAGTDYPVTFEDTRSTVKIPYSAEIPARVGVKEIALSPGATSIDQDTQLPVTNNTVTLTVTAEDGTTTQEYTVTVEKTDPSNEASMTSLTLTIETTDYPVTFTNKESTITVPYSTELPVDAVVKAVELADKATGVEVDETLNILALGPLTLTITAEDGKTTDTYTVTVEKTDPSNEASLISLTLTIETTDYPVTFTNKESTITVPHVTKLSDGAVVKAVELSTNATGVEVDGSLPIPASGTLTLTVTAEDGKTTETYTVAIKKAAPLSSEASITSLTLTIADTDYPVTFADTQHTLRVVPLGMLIPATVGVKDIVLSDGATGVADDDQLTVTNNRVTLTVTAEDGTTQQQYTVVIGFTSLGITSFTFEVPDNEGMALDEDDRKRIVGIINQQDKTITFDQQSAYIYLDKLKATFEVSEAGAAVQVGGEEQASGVTEQDFNTPMNYAVRAQDGTETVTYTVTLTKSIMATIEDGQFRKKLKDFVPAAFAGDQLNITHDDLVNNHTDLNISNQIPKLTSVKGIEFFTDLKVLYCQSNSLTSLDLSKNVALTTLDCGINALTSLNISKTTALMLLACGNNRLASLDVSKNTALTVLDCSNNALTSLDVSKNTALMRLYCNKNSLTSLDMTGVRSVTDGLKIGMGTGTDNPLETLRVNTALQDHTEIITMKTARAADLTITTVNNNGEVVCNDYAPAENGGNCN